MKRMQSFPVSKARIRDLNGQPLRGSGKYVLYWMISTRRTRSNYALDRAIELAIELDRPLLVLEALRSDYPFACDRFHRFVIDGMADNAAAFEKAGVLYHPYVEPKVGAGKGLLKQLASDACCVVTDDYPCFFLPRMVEAAAEALPIRLEAVDSNGLLPMRVAQKAFSRAFDFRRFLQRELRPHLQFPPRAQQLRSKLRPMSRLPQGISKRWPRATEALLEGNTNSLSKLPIDHDIAPISSRGGATAARQGLRDFLSERLQNYGEDRNQPEADASSRLSAYLHFGHIGTHEVLDKLAQYEDWSIESITDIRSGKREGWWGMSPAAESYLDQIVTWREVGFNFCLHRADYDRFNSLPDWAQSSLEQHATDKRPHVYSLEQFESATTHDSLWNAAQFQLKQDGRIHNYLRMLWGKKILHWSESPERALKIMLELNNKYAVDGRDPSSYTGIFWVLGRFDRAWGPEREIFGKVRYMASDNTRRKLRVNEYIKRWDPQGCLFPE